MDNFSARAQFTQPDATLTAEAIRYLNALQRAVETLQTQLAALEVRVRALEP